MTLDARKVAILFAVIEEHIRTAAPIASQAIVLHRAVDACAATIRNEMGILEEEGYLAQPHPSAGRIPTERAYRLYVEHLLHAECDADDAAVTLRRIFSPELEDVHVVGKEFAQSLAALAAEVIVVRFAPGDSYATGLSYLVVQPEFQELAVMRSFSAAMDDLDATLETLTERVDAEPRVILGAENPFGPRCAAVASRLALPGSSELAIGSVGPMRMAYDRQLGLLRTVHDLVEELYA